ncbi:16S rRNA (uracil(1498)-N(3))-methyltransferase [Acidipila sp. EB88]|uniref:RsmE family RNA methyltransferase n=1 Tax=Acidipila sp. EB88 TaxID=2305226 RepID=UPI000F5E64D3|nr:RsmE family RNA methyltransferase [Acidipila sp. EB88]RRA48652.1 16S rRNA (uracil(1498)-N(3))-methyltransferase [Acidipila sp. EB88]
MARRRWIADQWSEGRAELVGAQARHLAKVLRAEPGMRCDVVADGRVWSAVLDTVSEERAAFVLEQELAGDAALPLTLLLAVFKFDRLEWAIEKATELGVQRIVPVVARRTEKHLAQAAAARVERWRRIAHEAAKQSRRADLPEVHEPESLKAALARTWTGTRLLLAESERTMMLSDALLALTSGNTEAGVVMAVGPEGGWTADEELLFAKHAWQPVSLGPRILRAETAAIAATAVVASALL